MKKLLVVAIAVILIGELAQGDNAFANAFGVSNHIYGASYIETVTQNSNGSTTYSFTTQSLKTLIGDSNSHGGNYYTWGIINNILAGGNTTITNASLIFSNLSSLAINDYLHVDLLAGPQTGHVSSPNSNGNTTTYTGSSDNFWYAADLYPNGDTFDDFNLYRSGSSPTALSLTTFSGYSGTSTKTIALDQSQLTTLAQYVSLGNFGLGFDPDCEWYNTGLTFDFTVSPNPTPEPATIVLFGLGLVGFTGLRLKKSNKRLS